MPKLLEVFFSNELFFFALQPLLVSEHFAKIRFVSQSNTVLKTLLVSDHFSDKATTTTFKARNLTHSFDLCFWPERPPDTITHDCSKNHCPNVTNESQMNHCTMYRLLFNLVHIIFIQKGWGSDTCGQI